MLYKLNLKPEDTNSNSIENNSNNNSDTVQSTGVDLIFCGHNWGFLIEILNLNLAICWNTLKNFDTIFILKI